MVVWYLSDKSSLYAVEAAQRLLHGKLIETDGDFRVGRPRLRQDFESVFFRLLELHLSGAHFVAGSHGALLDEMAATLDRMSERRVQSGRGYTPSTIHDRSQLSVAFALILTAAASQANGGKILDRLKTYLSNERQLPNADLTVLAVLDFLDKIDRGLDPIDDKRAAVLKALKAEIDLRESTNIVRSLTRDARDHIKQLRNQRIRDRAIDPEKIRRLEILTDREMTSGRGHIPVFGSVSIRKTEDDSIALTEVRLGHVEKSELSAPQMGNASSNFFDVVADALSQNIAGYVWRDVRAVERSSFTLDSAITDLDFWHRLEALVAEVGPEPCLTVNAKDFSDFSERYLYRHKENPPLHIVRDRRRASIPEEHYAATVNGIDVFAIHGQPSQAWLFSGASLSELKYRVLDNGLVVSIAFAEAGDDPWLGRLDCSFGIEPVWKNLKVVEVNFAESEGGWTEI
jgi:hypothetical protein